MEDLSKQIEDISKQLLMNTTKVIDPTEFIRLEQAFRSDVEDLAVLQKIPLNIPTSFEVSTSPGFGPLHLDIPPPPLLSPPLYTQRKPVLWTDKSTMKSLPDINHIHYEPEFWKKYDSDQVIAISRENARNLAANYPSIGGHLMSDFEEALKGMKFLYDAIQDSVWDAELGYLNALEEQKRIQSSEFPLPRKMRKIHKSKVRNLYQKRSDMIEQKVEVLTSIVNSPFELLQILRGNPDMDELENMY